MRKLLRHMPAALRLSAARLEWWAKAPQPLAVSPAPACTSRTAEVHRW